MKTCNKIIFGLFFITIAFTSCGQSQVGNENSLPNNSKEFLQQHFAGIQISSVIIEDDKEYDAILADGTNVEFFRNGNWEKVERFGSAIPESIVPAKIAEYVKANFPNLYIEEISVERNGFDVELNNNIDIIFSKDGDFKRIDD